MRGLPPRRTLRGSYTPEGELVWTGLSDTSNPRSAEKAINNVVKVVVKELGKEGISEGRRLTAGLGGLPAGGILQVNDHN
jgi:hypothetical protein